MTVVNVGVVLVTVPQGACFSAMRKMTAWLLAVSEFETGWQAGSRRSLLFRTLCLHAVPVVIVSEDCDTFTAELCPSAGLTVGSIVCEPLLSGKKELMQGGPDMVPLAQE